MVAGVDVGGTTTKACVLADGHIVGKSRLPTSVDLPTDLGELSLTAVNDALSHAGATFDHLDAIGIGVPGQVSKGNVRYAANLGLGEDGFDLAGYVTSATGLDTTVENDMTMAAYGAFRRLTGEEGEITNLVYIGLGTGVSAGVILEGQVFRGSHGLAGEFGHVPMGTGHECACGTTGCLETVIGAGALQGAWGSPMTSSLFASAANGDRGAERIVDRALDHLAHAMWWLAATYDPDVFVIGGGVGANSPSIGRVIADKWRAMSADSALARRVLDPDRIRMSDLEEPVGAFGAALLAHDTRARSRKETQTATGGRNESI